MPKKIRHESFKYHLLIAAKKRSFYAIDPTLPTWGRFVADLDIGYDSGRVRIAWKGTKSGEVEFQLSEPCFYVRGDSESGVTKQSASGMLDREDPVKLSNDVYFHEAVRRLALAAGFQEEEANSMRNERYQKERAFHDAWSEGEHLDKIDVHNTNEACTAPEMRYITERLADLHGKRLLDVGCGLGEASVYFALRGANVTAADLSPGMLAATTRLAQANGVEVNTHLSAAEDMKLASETKFDVIYAGNLLHHVDIEETISRLKPHLEIDGMQVTWDPLAYNPVINVYRFIAKGVRTPDEHPLKWKDIKTFHKHFDHVETRYFWLLTLAIFLVMALVQRRNPNKERFWKVVIQEGEKWRWLYRPLEIMDRAILALVPPLRLLCWNVVIVARQPRR